MTHQPMGVSGVDTDIVTGRPAYEQRLFELAKDDPFLRGLDMQATADAAPRSLLNRPADGLR